MPSQGASACTLHNHGLASGVQQAEISLTRYYHHAMRCAGVGHADKAVPIQHGYAHHGHHCSEVGRG